MPEHTWTFGTILTIKTLDVFDVLKRQLQLIVWDNVVCWVHDSARVRGVRQAKCMTKFMGSYSQQVDT